jgi:hypothetical protein
MGFFALVAARFLCGCGGGLMLKDMKTRKHLKPGQMGTKRLVEQFGDALLCVRYRYDEKRGVQLKTVEIVVEEKAAGPVVRFRDDDLVKLIVAFTEKGLRDRLKAKGGRWDPQEKLWLVRYGAVRGTELEDRILAD